LPSRSETPRWPTVFWIVWCTTLWVVWCTMVTTPRCTASPRAGGAAARRRQPKGEVFPIARPRSRPSLTQVFMSGKLRFLAENERRGGEVRQPRAHGPGRCAPRTTTRKRRGNDAPRRRQVYINQEGHCDQIRFQSTDPWSLQAPVTTPESLRSERDAYYLWH